MKFKLYLKRVITLNLEIDRESLILTYMSKDEEAKDLKQKVESLTKEK